MIIFCDIDGVLFDISHRLHYQQSGDYESFYSDDALAGDSIINGGVSLVRGLIRGYNCPFRLCFVTGRPERTRTMTEHRLQYLDIDDASFSLHMRKDGDYRPSPQIKVELESIDPLRDELDVARLTLEQADLTKEKLRNEVAQLKQKLSDERQKNRQLKEQINDLKLKKILKDNKVKQTRKGKK